MAALAVWLVHFGQSNFDKVMNINIEVLMGATGPLHFTHHYYIHVHMRSAGQALADYNGSR